MKKFILGLIVGLILPVSMAYASDYVISQNQFPVFVNGTRQDVDALNINGSTWLRLGDVGSVLGASVVFDEVSKQISIITSDSSVESVESEVTTLSNEDQTIARSKFTPDGIEAYYSEDNKVYYVICTDFNAKYESQGYRIRINVLDSSKPVCLYKNGEIILQGVDKKESGGMEYDYYVNTILPLIQ